MVWSLAAAKQKGVAIDQGRLKEWSAWATDWHDFAPQINGAVADREVTVRGQCDAIAQLLSGHALADARADQPQWAVEYAKDLAKGQQADGSWTSGGQLPSQKRPKRGTQEVSTMWALLALSTSHIEGNSLSPLVDKGRAWLGNETVGKSTEWWATRFMLDESSAALIRPTITAANFSNGSERMVAGAGCARTIVTPWARVLHRFHFVKINSTRHDRQLLRLASS